PEENNTVPEPEENDTTPPPPPPQPEDPDYVIPDLKKHLVGYFSTWGGNGPTKYIDLEAVPQAYDTIAVSFIEHEADNVAPKFNPETYIRDTGVTNAQFKQKVANMRAKGHDVIIAVGGQNGVFHLKSQNDQKVFREGVIRII
ncbi:MAG: hypothetical protein ACRC5V_07405, partial [Aeromonas sp.]